HPDAQLTIVGCSPDVDVRNCQVVGQIPLADVGKYYDAASVFCMPTTLEPFGIAFIEAFAHSLPVIATRVGAIPELVRDGESGYLVQPNDVNALAERLIELVGDPAKCRAFGERGRRLVKEKYNW